MISTLVRRDGLRIRSGYAPTFLKHLARVELSAELREEVAPPLMLLHSLNVEIKQADARLAKLAEDGEVIALLCTVPGVGPVTVASFVSTLDDPARFAGAKEARAYLGLVPSEYSSGERRRRGHISKAGPSRARHACGGGVMYPQEEEQQECRASRLGRRHRCEARIEGGGHRAGAEAARHPLRNVAGLDLLLGPLATARRGSRGGLVVRRL